MTPVSDLKCCDLNTCYVQAGEVAPEVDQPVSDCSGLQVVPAQAAAVVCTNKPSPTSLGLAVYMPSVAVLIQMSAFAVTRIRLAVLLIADTLLPTATLATVSSCQALLLTKF